MKPNPSRSRLGPFARRVLNGPGRDLMVEADTCGYANYYDERIADCAYCGQLSGNGMDTIHHNITARARPPATAPMTWNSTYAETESRDIARPSPIQFTTNPQVASAANDRTISTNEFSIALLPQDRHPSQPCSTATASQNSPVQSTLSPGEED
jgi:hypothetical protein